MLGGAALFGLLRKDVAKFRVADFLREHSGAYSNVKAMKSSRPGRSGRSHGDTEATTPTFLHIQNFELALMLRCKQMRKPDGSYSIHFE